MVPLTGRPPGPSNHINLTPVPPPPHTHTPTHINKIKQGRVFLTPRGIGPGGTGLVNAMQYSRGYAADYDGWPWPLAAIEGCGCGLFVCLCREWVDDVCGMRMRRLSLAAGGD